MSLESGKPRRVAIVGGGISGLSAAYHLEKLAAQADIAVSLSIFESSLRVGGVIQTERAGKLLIEGGPDSFLAQKPAAIELCRELGLGEELIGSNDERRKTYVFQGGRLHELPDGLMFVVPTRVWPVFRSDLLSLKGKLRLVLAPLLPPMEQRKDDWAVSDFISRRFGREVLERLAEPLLAAVYGADVDSLSARAALPQLVAIEEKYGNLWRGLPHALAHARSGAKGSLFVTLRDGLGGMVEKLHQALRRTSVLTGTNVESIQRAGDRGGFTLHYGGREQAADALIMATPAPVAARLLQGLDRTLAGHLGAITHHSSVIVALGYNRSEFAAAAEGFGFVVPRREGKALTACTFVSNKFPFRSEPDKVLLRCFLGSARNPTVLESTDEEILAMTLRELEEILRLRATPTFSRVYRWEQRMPQYNVGHQSRLEAIAASLKAHSGLYLAGNAYRGVGISDCIQSGCQAASSALEYLRAGL